MPQSKNRPHSLRCDVAQLTPHCRPRRYCCSQMDLPHRSGVYLGGVHHTECHTDTVLAASAEDPAPHSRIRHSLESLLHVFLLSLP